MSVSVSVSGPGFLGPGLRLRQGLGMPRRSADTAGSWTERPLKLVGRLRPSLHKPLLILMNSSHQRSLLSLLSIPSPCLSLSLSPGPKNPGPETDTDTDTDTALQEISDPGAMISLLAMSCDEQPQQVRN